MARCASRPARSMSSILRWCRISRCSRCIAVPRLGPVGGIVEQDALRCAVHVFVLPRFQRPEEGREAEPAHAKRDRDEEEQDVHCSLAFPRRSAFRITMIDELDMATAAISGVTWPRIASGTAARL